MKSAFGTVIYKQGLDYLDDFISSVNGQTYHDFDLILLNDDLSTKQIADIVEKIKVNYLLFNSNKLYNNPVQLRIKLLESARYHHYDLLILGDADDIFSANRVEKIVGEFSDDYDFFYNDLNYFNTENIFFKELPNYTTNIYDILEFNYLGLSNSAISLKNISKDILDQLKKCDTHIFDWYMFSIFLLNGLKGKRVNGCNTQYRIHESNIAGASNFSLGNVHREINVKLAHYGALRCRHQLFADRYKKYQAIKHIINKLRPGEIESIMDKDMNNFWWSKINSSRKEWRNLCGF